MYMTVEMLPVIGLFALLATAAGWARTIYLSVGQRERRREDARHRAASARELFKASRATERERTSAAAAREAHQPS